MNPIVVGVDGSEAARRALQVAAELAKATSSSLVLVYGLVPPVMPMDVSGYATSQLWADQRSWAEKMLSDARKSLPRELTSEDSLDIGQPAEVLRHAAKRVNASLVVVGTVGAGATARALLGSTAHKVVHHEERPVLVVRHDWRPVVRSFFVAVDDSAPSLGAARLASSLAARLPGAKLELVHVSLPNLIPDHAPYRQLVQTLEAEEKERIEGLFRSVKAKLDPLPEPAATRRLIGGPEAFLDYAEQQGADCYVVGSRGRNAFARVMLGSFADRVLNAGRRHVLIVR